MCENTEYLITSTSQAFLQDSCIRSIGQEIGFLFGDSIKKHVDNSDSKDAGKKVITQICIHSSAPILCYERLFAKVMDNSIDYDFINKLCNDGTGKPNNVVGLYIFRRRSKLKLYLEDYILHRTLTERVRAKYPYNLFPVCMIDQNDNSRQDNQFASAYAFSSVFHVVDMSFRTLTKRISVKTVNMGDLALLEGIVMDNNDLIQKHSFEFNPSENDVHKLQEKTFNAFSKAKDDYMKTANEYSALKHEIDMMERALNRESGCCHILDQLVIEQQFQLMSLNHDGSMQVHQLQK